MFGLDSEGSAAGVQPRLTAKKKKRKFPTKNRGIVFASVSRDLFYDCRKNLVRVHILCLGLKIENQAMAQRWIDHRLDIIIAHMDPPLDECISFRAQNDRLGPARAGAEAEETLDLGYSVVTFLLSRLSGVDQTNHIIFQPRGGQELPQPKVHLVRPTSALFRYGLGLLLGSWGPPARGGLR